MARDYIVATFDTRDQAYGAARDIDHLDDSVVDVKSGVVVEKDMLGNVTQLDAKDLTPPWGTIGGATSGALLGGLIGALAGPAGVAAGAVAGGAGLGGLFGGSVGAIADLGDAGMKEDYVAAVSGRLLPGRSALVAEVEEFQTQPVDEAVWKHGGVIFRHPLEYPVV